MIVDSQVHTTTRGAGRWAKYDVSDRLQANLFPATVDLLREMDAAGVDAAVLVPPLSLHSRPDNGPWLRDAKDHRNRLGVMGRFAIEDAGEVHLLEDWLSTPGMLGIRLSFTRERGNIGLLEEGKLEWLWSGAERNRIPVMINAPGQIKSLYSIAAAHTSLRLIVDHLGLPGQRYDDLLGAVKPSLRLARLDNVALKATCLPVLVGESYPFPTLQECIRVVVDEFGAGRIFWGSDLHRLPCPYSELVRFFREELSFLDFGDRMKVLGEGLLSWLNWRPGASRDESDLSQL